MNQTAAQRALCIFEIVDLIASRIQTDFSTIARGPECIRLWNHGGFIARGVNSLWKQAFDQRLLCSAMDSSSGYTELRSRQLPFLRIMATSSELSSSLKRIKADSFFLFREQLEAVCNVLLHSIENLQSLSVEIRFLVAFSAQFRARPALRFSHLRELEVDFYIYRLREEINAEDAENVALSLGTMTSVTSLRLRLVRVWSRRLQQYVPPAQQLELARRIPGKAVRCLELFYDTFNGYSVDRDIRQLASVIDHFEHIEALSLIFGHASSLKDAIPTTVQMLKVRCPVAGISCVLAMLSDEKELPQLSAVPDLDYNDEPHIIVEPSPAITVDMVDRAIAGLKRRGGVLDIEISGPRLYKLVRKAVHTWAEDDW